MPRPPFEVTVKAGPVSASDVSTSTFADRKLWSILALCDSLTSTAVIYVHLTSASESTYNVTRSRPCLLPHPSQPGHQEDENEWRMKQGEGQVSTNGQFRPQNWSSCANPAWWFWTKVTTLSLRFWRPAFGRSCAEMLWIPKAHQLAALPKGSKRKLSTSNLKDSKAWKRQVHWAIHLQCSLWTLTGSQCILQQ